jgi:uncharacterized membrane protein YgcG
VVLAVLPALAAIAVGWGPGAAAAWADSGESIRSFDARIDVDPRGDMIVTETIEYDFGPDGRHGVQRELLTRFAQPGGYEDRIYPVTDATASSPSGAPSALAVSETSSSTVLRVGDPQQTVRGRQTYVLRYTVGGAFNRLTTSTPLRDDEGGGALPPHDELYWNVTGAEWDVPIGRVTVAVAAPQPASAARCYRGLPGSTEPCSGAAGTTSTFSTGDLPPGQGLTVALAYPTGMVSAPGPVLVYAAQPPTPAEPSIAGKILGLVLVLVVVGGLVVLFRVMRGWVAAAEPPAPVARPVGKAQRLRSAAPMRLEPLTPADGPLPPRDLRPGQLATLLEGRASTIAVTASLVDLAVRGFLRIEELPGAAGRATNWRLVRAQPPPTERLLPYEDSLLQAVFARRTTVTVGELRNTFARHLAQVQDELLHDAVGRGWFADGALAIQARWRSAGTVGWIVAVAIVPVSVLGSFFAGSVLPFGSLFVLVLVVIGVGAIGQLVAAIGRRRLARSAAGDAVLAGTEGFRAELAARTVSGLRTERASEVFSRSLPYAMVLGLSGHWSRLFEGGARSGALTRSPGWYVGAATTAGFLDLNSGLTAFTTTATSAMSSTPGSSGSSGFGSSSSSSSSSSGSSGGGGGGGGGGSW